ncbi:hypothetical protein GCM10010387_17640 [Streptomyces inusitatus]|uniref:Uncharacterized protein n=1 Tax=Streptomyces inusitatus TaxID=68221 RepID=A0A918PVW1_9ACTN|nr:DUF6227 family protein [Streptomyces inusitatus]GGZ24708.1 hypothetical protein GCM10010387_17640 [Streptomyces inusitatus]
MNDPHETTEAHLKRLLGRALNSFDLPDTTVERLDSALAHASSLHSSHHSGSLDRATYRHTYLLSDGSALTLWELVHSTGPRGGVEQHELYTEESEVRLAASRLPAGFPGFADTDEPGGIAPSPFPPPRADDGPAWSSGRPEAARPGPTGPSDDPDADFALLADLIAAPPAALPRMYAPDDSADHARRVLRRAENADRPGEKTARLLRSSFAHHITQVSARQCLVGGKDAGFTLYEHAFLLLDGAEISLWEVEHTATPDGRHMCEVYLSEHAAREAMELRARVR